MAILKELNGRLAARTWSRSSRALAAERCSIQGLSLYIYPGLFVSVTRSSIPIINPCLSCGCVSPFN